MNKYLIAIIALLSFGAVGIAHANPTFFAKTVQTATATSSVAYMGVGTATSTLTYDSSADVLAGGQLVSPSQIALGMQFIASSTSTVFNVNIQYSQNGIDWYQDDVNGQLATTTPVNLGLTNSYTYKATGTATTSFMTVLKIPVRFIRAQFSVTGAAGGVWAQMVPTKEAK